MTPQLINRITEFIQLKINYWIKRINIWILSEEGLRRRKVLEKLKDIEIRIGSSNIYLKGMPEWKKMIKEMKRK